MLWTAIIHIQETSKNKALNWGLVTIIEGSLTSSWWEDLTCIESIAEGFTSLSVGTSQRQRHTESSMAFIISKAHPQSHNYPQSTYLLEWEHTYSKTESQNREQTFKYKIKWEEFSFNHITMFTQIMLTRLSLFPQTNKQEIWIHRRGIL